MDDYETKFIERQVARDILRIIDTVCFSNDFKAYRHNYGSKGERDLIIQMIQDKYGVI